MPEHENDGFYWEPTPRDDLRQGDLLFNVPIALMPQQPRFVFGPADEVMTQTYADYPDNAPSDQIVVEAIIPDIARARNILAGNNVPLYMFPLPRTDLGGGAVLGFNAVALLDRPASMLKDNLRDYRRLGLYVESRIALRMTMARFWARGNADDSIERAMRPQLEKRPLEDLE